MKYLFVCNGNVARSQEAECFFNALKSSSDDTALSAGINVKLGKPIDPMVVEVMKEQGYDLTAATRKFVDEAMVRDADKIISFKPLHELPEYTQQRSENIIFWNIDDPQHQNLEFHRKVRDEIQTLVTKLVAH